MNTVHAVFTDCRFINEAQAIRDAGGQVWRVRRPSVDFPAPKWWQVWRKKLHQSETEMDSVKFENLVTQIIDNRGSLEDLSKLVAAALHLTRSIK